MNTGTPDPSLHGASKDQTNGGSSFLNKAVKALGWIAVLMVAAISGVIGEDLARSYLDDGPQAVDFQAKSVHGLSLRAPVPFERITLSDTAEATANQQPWLADQETYMWSGEEGYVAVNYLELQPGSTYNLTQGLRDGIDNVASNMRRKFGGETSSYNIRDTTLSGFPAVTAERIVRGEELRLVIRALTAKSAQNVWSVSVFGVDSDRTHDIADSVFSSLSIQ